MLFRSISAWRVCWQAADLVRRRNRFGGGSSIGSQAAKTALVETGSMIVGDTQVFAIESEITEAYASLGLRALGFFVIHVGGSRYGVYDPNATMGDAISSFACELVRTGQDRGRISGCSLCRRTEG